MKIDNILKKKLKTAIISELKSEQKNMILVETPYPISEQEMACLKTRFPSIREKTLVNKVVPGLIGGFIIKLNSRVIDVSIKGEIDNIVRELTFS